MANHKHGGMNIAEQEKTFQCFIAFTARATIGIIVTLILLALING